MRMKAVCEATGLTDRAVRYYIEEGLIAPDYTENYTGRKTFDFSEADIRRLRDISVLRKFGFTVAEIRDMLTNPERIGPTVEDLRERKRLEITEEQTLLDALERLTAPCETVSELALALCAPVQTALVPVEDSRISIEDACRGFIVSTFRTMLAWAPVAASAWGFLNTVTGYEYPTFRSSAQLLNLVCLIPSLVILNWQRLREWFGWKKISFWVWILCFLSIPFCAIFSLGYVGGGSVTTDFRNYRDFDSECLVNRDVFFSQFFPTWPHYFDHVYNEDGQIEEVWLDASYYYHYSLGWDPTYDIYAEWPYLTQEEFDKEVARVTALFEGRESYYESECYPQTQKGPWTCLILCTPSQEPFREVTSSYSYYIFAYDPNALRVRYIHCYSMDDGYDQPYYLELDWE